jgi:hypothetical protein
MNKYNDLRQNLQVFDFALEMRKQTYDRIAEGNYDSFGRWLKSNFMLNKKDFEDWTYNITKMDARRQLHSFSDIDRGVILAIFDEPVTLVHSSATFGRLASLKTHVQQEIKDKGKTCNNTFTYTVKPYQPMLVNLNMAQGILKHPLKWSMISLRLDWTMREWLEYILAMGQQQQ